MILWLGQLQFLLEIWTAWVKVYYNSPCPNQLLFLWQFPFTTSRQNEFTIRSAYVLFWNTPYIKVSYLNSPHKNYSISVS